MKFARQENIQYKFVVFTLNLVLLKLLVLVILNLVTKYLLLIEI